MKIHTFETGPYFSSTSRFVVFTLSAVIFFMALANSILFLILFGPLLIIAALVVTFQQYFIAIDTEKNQYYDGTIVFGIKSGSWHPYSALDLLYFYQKRYSRKINSFASSTTVRSASYDGYLRFTDGEKIQLISEPDEKKAIELMTEIARKLNLNLYQHDELIYEAGREHRQTEKA
ncbi:hypothetical protein AB9P05_00510 [Roseivirga sp. BDSF3-8]|uniref:hypothetical protein n=1 Tax=Roseivirga sp. BDSF3-8 TaxID=3241598 RepID=UPI0035320A2A